METSLGKVAYDAYGETRGWRVFGGERMPRWEEQAPPLRAAWDAAAGAVAAAVGLGDAVGFEAMGDLGVIQEVNRLLLHPVGLALQRHPDGRVSMLEDDDPAGWVFDGFDLHPAAKVFRERQLEWHPRRVKALGYVVQPEAG